MAVFKNDLHKFLDAKKTPTRLIGDIERHLLARPAGDRDYTVLHPSEIIKKDWCKRASYFLLSGHKRIAEKPNLRLQSIFDEGHAIHDKWQTWFQGKWAYSMVALLAWVVNLACLTQAQPAVQTVTLQ